MVLVPRTVVRSGELGALRLSRSFRQNWSKGTVACLQINDRHISSLVTDFEPDEMQDDSKSTVKDKALRLALSQLASEFSQESMLSLQRFFSSRRAPVISTGSLRLDQALGVGGLPKGRIVEIYGKEASGKSTLALHVIKEAQRLGGYCAYLDVENVLDPSLAVSIGVNTEELLLCRPDSAENMLSVVDMLTKSRSVDVIVVDSVAALVPQSELDVPIGRTYEDEQSKIMTQALRRVHYSLCNSQTLIIFLNQVRSNVKSCTRFAYLEEVTCGGNALKFYAAVRLRMTKTGLIKTEDKITGLSVCVQVIKNKLAPGTKKAELGIHFGRGFHLAHEILELACEQGVIIQEGNSYFIDGEVVTGKRAAEMYLADNPEVRGNVVAILREKFFAR